MGDGGGGRGLGTRKQKGLLAPRRGALGEEGKRMDVRLGFGACPRAGGRRHRWVVRTEVRGRRGGGRDSRSFSLLSSCEGGPDRKVEVARLGG